MRYRPPSYFPKKTFAPGNASNAGSPNCQVWLGQGTGVIPGRPSALGRGDRKTAMHAARAAQKKPVERTRGSFSSRLGEDPEKCVASPHAETFAKTVDRIAASDKSE